MDWSQANVRKFPPPLNGTLHTLHKLVHRYSVLSHQRTKWKTVSFHEPLDVSFLPSYTLNWHFHYSFNYYSPNSWVHLLYCSVITQKQAILLCSIQLIRNNYRPCVQHFLHSTLKRNGVISERLGSFSYFLVFSWTIGRLDWSNTHSFNILNWHFHKLFCSVWIERLKFQCIAIIQKPIDYSTIYFKKQQNY